MSLTTNTDCCSNTQSKSACPQCHKQKHGVNVLTLKHWLVASLVPRAGEGPFYFCDTKGCDVVYFSEDHSVRYNQKQMRDHIGSKGASEPAIICYCFGVSKEMISEEIVKTGKSSFFSWIKKEVSQGYCACEIRNPSGRCCLKEIKELESSLKKVAVTESWVDDCGP